MSTYSIERIEKEDWLCSEKMDSCYGESFHDQRPRHLERCDFTLVVSNHDNPIAFVTCIEMDSETVYWQFGGAFDYIKKTINVINAYREFIYYMQINKYRRITTRIENTNIPMLKLAMKCGFLVVGTWNFKNVIYLELLNEFGVGVCQ